MSMFTRRSSTLLTDRPALACFTPPRPTIVKPLDGSAGEVLLGDVPTSDSEVVRVLTGKLTPAKAPRQRRVSQCSA